jgi:hypothetical protein
LFLTDSFPSPTATAVVVVVVVVEGKYEERKFFLLSLLVARFPRWVMRNVLQMEKLLLIFLPSVKTLLASSSYLFLLNSQSRIKSNKFAIDLASQSFVVQHKLNCGRKISL